MANNQVTIKPIANEVNAQGVNRFITVTNNVTGTTVNLTQTNPEVIRVTAPGPSGVSGTSGTSGTGGAFLTGSTSTNNGIPISVSGSGALEVQSNLTFDGNVLNIIGNVFVQGTLDAATKNFKIDHPTIPEYYLVHSSLEGPERGIYYRGKLKAIDTIHLPDYWNELTDDTDITVQLTPIGNSCQHFVKSVTQKEIIVGCDCGTPHCFYIVHAQRFNEGKFNILEPKKTKSL